MSDLIEDHLRWLRAGGTAEKTIADRVQLLRHADRHEALPYGLDQAHRDEIAAYLGRRLSAWSRSTYWSHLWGFYEWAVLAAELTLNPMVGLRRPRGGHTLPHPVSDDELEVAFARSPAQPWRMAVMLAAYAGLRASELRRLDRADVTAERITVRAGKGGRDGYVDTHPLLWDYVRDRPPGPLVRSSRGDPLGVNYFRNQCRHWRRIGLAGVHLHRFRAWFATTQLREGVDIRIIQELMRHESLATTAIYTQVTSEQRRFAIRTLPAPTTSTHKSTAV